MMDIRYNKKNWSIERKYKKYENRKELVPILIAPAFGIVLISAIAMIGIFIKDENLCEILLTIIILCFILGAFFFILYSMMHPKFSFDEYYQRYIIKSRKTQERKNKRWLM